ncbi:effector-associated constant component EACC1 [Nodosilinea nodulosa]|uniref:effector-associated constant component EACC1 n=1 Tax=Nodosilinea nodulosa TaxID=416001 RepID=UPI00037DAC2F|nr:hypothetical protein [Nodosilinea nodulosa]
MTDINLELELQGQDATEETLLSLQDWIQQEHISGLKQVEPETGEAETGKMGIDPITVLSVVLASQAVIELVKAIHVWIQATRPKVTMKVQVAENSFVEVSAENLPEMNLFVDQVLQKVKALEAGD